MAEITEALETVENRRCRLGADAIADRHGNAVAAGGCRAACPHPNRRVMHSPSFSYRAPADKNLQIAFRKCDCCGRLGIQPCSRCDSNQ